MNFPHRRRSPNRAAQPGWRTLLYITRIGNVSSILRSGILSHNRARYVQRDRVDLDAVQEIRAGVRVGSRMLHDHANLYVCGRNAMMYYVTHHNPIDDLCLLRVSPDVLDLTDVVVTDGNAARQRMTRMYDARTGIEALDFDRIHDEFWTRGNASQNDEHKRVKQAEVLIPDWVEPGLLLGAYTPSRTAYDGVLAATGDRLASQVAKYPFFQGPKGT